MICVEKESQSMHAHTIKLATDVKGEMVHQANAVHKSKGCEVVANVITKR